MNLDKFKESLNKGMDKLTDIASTIVKTTNEKISEIIRDKEEDKEESMIAKIMEWNSKALLFEKLTIDVPMGQLNLKYFLESETQAKYYGLLYEIIKSGARNQLPLTGSVRFRHNGIDYIDLDKDIDFSLEDNGEQIRILNDNQGVIVSIANMDSISRNEIYRNKLLWVGSSFNEKTYSEMYKELDPRFKESIDILYGDNIKWLINGYNPNYNLPLNQLENMDIILASINYKISELHEIQSRLGVKDIINSKEFEEKAYIDNLSRMIDFEKAYYEETSNINRDEKEG